MISFRRVLERGDTDGQTLDVYLTGKKQEGRELQLSHFVAGLNTPGPSVAAPERVPAGFPWITPVLGSGTVREALKDGGAPLRRRVHEFATLLGDEPLPEGVPRDELAVRFAEALIEERLPESWDRQGPLGVSQQVDPLERPTALLVLCAAILTRLRDEVAAASVSPVPRWDDDRRRAISDSGPSAPELAKAFQAPAISALKELQQDLAIRSIERGVVRLVEDLLNAVVEDRLPTMAEVRLLTECAWFYLVRDCLTSPGWSDLLLELSLNHLRIPHQEGRARPLSTRIDRSADQIMRQYRTVAEESWKSRLSGTLASPVHDDVAAMLIAQARLQATNPGPFTVPLASAFVTGFDLELELALVDAGQSFVLAIPALASSTYEAATGSLVWLGFVIDASKVKRASPLAAFDRAEAIVLSGCDQFGHTAKTHRDLPVVVRLTGCPAVGLPVKGTNPGLYARVAELVGWGAEAPAGASLEPIFVLDEYVAGILASMEIFLDHLDDARLGLPRWIAGTPGGVNSRFTRFWLVMGAQLSDTSIRQRLVAQLAASAMNSPARRSVGSDARGDSGLTGLVVNRRIGPLDGRIMQWQGFDIVQDECENLAPHLRHYTDHLKFPGFRFAHAGGCTPR